MGSRVRNHSETFHSEFEISGDYEVIDGYTDDTDIIYDYTDLKYTTCSSTSTVSSNGEYENGNCNNPY